MSPNEAPNDAGDAILAAFTNPTGNLTKEVKIVDDNGKETGKTKPRFILRSHGYLDVKAYISAGMGFPPSKPSFEGLHPKAKLAKLIALDSAIYQETEDAMVGVYTSCEAFNKEALPNFRLITNETREYAEYAISQLTGLGEGSFQGMLDILTSDKYAKDGSEKSDEFQGAAQGASDILLDLSTQAKEKAGTIKGLVKQITSFEHQLETDKTRVDGICKKYYGNGEKDSGYIANLNAGLTQLRKDVDTAAAAAKAAHDDFEYDCSVATWTAAYIWIPISGWIAGTAVAIAYNDKAKEAYKEYLKQLEKEKEKNSEVMSLEAVIGDVQLLSNQNKTISEKMARAILALSEIQKLFEQLAIDLGHASSTMGAADGFVRKSLFLRKKMLRSRVESAVESWQDALSATEELLATDSNIETTGIVEGVTAPKIE